MKETVSIIIPTYNEYSSIQIIVPKLDAELKKARIQYRLIIVDDNSPDGTGKEAEKLSKSYPITVIHRKGKLGLATAVIDGFNAAKTDVIGVMDCDLSHPPDIIPKVIEPVLDNKADLALGSRYVKGGGVENWPLSRWIISKGATMLSRPLTKVHDPMSGLFFLKKDLLKGIILKPKGYKILLEVLVKCKIKKVVEVPYVFRNRYVGTSKCSTGTMLKYIQHLKDLYKFRIFGR